MRKKKGRKLLTATNVIILICIVVYILNVFVVSPDTGYVSKGIMEVLTEVLKEMGVEEVPASYKVLYQILGYWGGNVNALLRFVLNNL